MNLTLPTPEKRAEMAAFRAFADRVIPVSAENRDHAITSIAMQASKYGTVSEKQRECLRKYAEKHGIS